MAINLTDAMNKLRQALNESQNRYTPAQTNSHVQRSLNTNNITNNSRLKSRPTSKVSATVNPVGTNVSRIRKLGTQTNYNNRSTNTHNAVVNRQNSTNTAPNNVANAITRAAQNVAQNVQKTLDNNPINSAGNLGSKYLRNRPTTADRVNAQRKLANPENYQQEVNRQGILSGDEQLIMRGQLPSQYQTNNTQAQSEYDRLLGVMQDQIRRDQASRISQAQADDLVDSALQVLTPEFLYRYAPNSLKNVNTGNNDLRSRSANTLILSSIENNQDLRNFVRSQFNVDENTARNLVSIAVSNAKEQFNTQQAIDRATNQKEVNNPLDYVASLVQGLSSGANTGFQGLNQEINNLSLLNPFQSDLERRADEERLKAMASLSENLATPEYENVGGIAGYGQQIAPIIGGQIAQMLVGSAFGPAAGMGTLFASAMGSSTGQALREGADYDEALLYGLTSGSIEMLTEKLTGGIPGLGIGGADNVANNLIQKFIGNRAGRNIAHFFYSMAGEGAEELLSEYLGAFAKGIYDDETRKKDFGTIIAETTPDAINSFILGSLTGGILNAYGTYRANRNSVDLTLNDQQIDLLRKAETDPQSITESDLSQLLQMDITGKFIDGFNNKNLTPEAKRIQQIINSEVREYDDSHEYFDTSYAGGVNLGSPTFSVDINELNNVRLAAQNQIVQDLYDELGMPLIQADSVQTMPNVQQIMNGETALIDTGKNYDNVDGDISRVQDVDNLVIQSNNEADLYTILDYFQNNYNANVLYAKDSYGQPAIVVEFNTVDLDGSVPSTPAHIIIVPSYSKYVFNNSLINRVDELESKAKLTNDEAKELANKKFDLQLVNRNNYYSKLWQDIQNYAGTSQGDVASLDQFLYRNGTLRDYSQTSNGSYSDDSYIDIGVPEYLAQQNMARIVNEARERANRVTQYPNTIQQVKSAQYSTDEQIGQALNDSGLLDDVVGIDPASVDYLNTVLNDEYIDDMQPEISVAILDEMTGDSPNDGSLRRTIGLDELHEFDYRLDDPVIVENTPLAQSIFNTEDRSFNGTGKALSKYFGIEYDNEVKNALSNIRDDIRYNGAINDSNVTLLADVISGKSGADVNSVKTELNGALGSLEIKLLPVIREMNIREYGQQRLNQGQDVAVESETPQGRVSQTVKSVANSNMFTEQTRQNLMDMASRGDFSRDSRNFAQFYSEMEDFVDNYKGNIVNDLLTDDPATNGFSMFGNLDRAQAVLSIVEERLKAQGNYEDAGRLGVVWQKYASQSGQDLNTVQQIYKMFPKKARDEAIIAQTEEIINQANRALGRDNDGNAPKIVLTEQDKADLRNAKNPSQKQKEIATRILRASRNSSIGAKLQALRYAFMLYNPKTWFRNFLGNKINTGFNNIVVNNINALLDKTVGKGLAKSGGNNYLPTTTFTVEKKYKDLARRILPTEKEINNGARVLVNLDTGTKYGSADIDSLAFNSDWGRKFYKTITKPMDLALNTGDKVFFDATFRDRLARFLQANKNTVDFDFVERYFTDDNIKLTNEADQNKANIIERGIEYANQQALKSVYRQKNELVSVLNRLQNQDSRSARFAYRLLNLAQPFLRTNLNITTQALENSPVGLAMGIYDTYRAFKNKGKKSGHEALNELAHGLGGTGAVALGYILYNLGMITGSGQDMDDEEREILEDVYGWQPYSIHIRNGDKDIYYDMSWANPMATSIALGSAIAESDIVKTGELTTDDPIALMQALSTALITPVTDMSMMESLEYIAPYNSDSMSDAITQVVFNILENAVSGFVTPSLLRNINRAFIDPTIRTVNGSTKGDTGYFGARVKSGLPVLSKDLQPALNSQGNTMMYGESWNDLFGLPKDSVVGRIFSQFVSPGDMTSNNNNATTDELMRLSGQTGEHGILPDTSVERKVTYDGKDYELTNEQFTHYNQQLRTERDQMIQELQNTQIYQNMTDQEKVDMIDDYDSYLKEKVKNEYLRSQGVKVEDSSTVRKAEAAEKLGMDMAEYFLIKHNAGTSQADIMTYMLNSGYTADEVNDYIFNVEKGGVWTPDKEYQVQIEMYNNPNGQWNYDTVHQLVNQYSGQMQSLASQRGYDQEATDKAMYNLEETLRDYIAAQYAASMGYDYSDTNAGRLARAEQYGMSIPEFVLINSNSSYVDRVVYMLENGYDWDSVNRVLSYVYDHELSENDYTKLSQMGY